MRSISFWGHSVCSVQWKSTIGGHTGNRIEAATFSQPKLMNTRNGIIFGLARHHRKHWPIEIRWENFFNALLLRLTVETIDGNCSFIEIERTLDHCWTERVHSEASIVNTVPSLSHHISTAKKAIGTFPWSLQRFFSFLYACWQMTFYGAIRQFEQNDFAYSVELALSPSTHACEHNFILSIICAF